MMVHEFTFRQPAASTGARRDLWQAVLAVIATTVIVAVFFFWSHAQLTEKAAEAAACASGRALGGHTVLLIDRTDPITQGQKQALVTIVKEISGDLRANEKFSIYAIDGEEPQIPHALFDGCSPGSRATADSVTQSPELIQRAFEKTILSPALSVIDGLNVRTASGQSPIIETIKTLTLLWDFGERVPNRRLDVFSDMLQNSAYSQYRDTPNYQEFKKSPLFRSLRLDLRGVQVVIHYLRRIRDARWQSNAQIMFWRDLVEDAGGTVAITLVDDNEPPASPPLAARAGIARMGGAPSLVPQPEQTPGAASELNGNVGYSAKWGSSWLDLGQIQNFSAGDTLRIKLEDREAKCVLVRLLGRDDSADEPVGIVGGKRDVGGDKTVVVKLPADRKLIKQISVLGREPWGRVICPGNGAARIESIVYISAHR